MTDIASVLRKYHMAREDELRYESERLGALRRLSEQMGYPRDSDWDAHDLIQHAESTAATGILTAEPDEALLEALAAAYAAGARYQAAVDRHRDATDLLRDALLRLHDPPSRDDVHTAAQCEAIASRVVCQEWIARRLTAPLPEPALTDSDGRPVEEVGHE